MNVIYKVIQEQFKNAEDEDGNYPSSPSNTVLGALTPKSISKEPIISKIEMSTHNKGIKIKIPHHIEDIPFRRQDKRILNARKKRIVDRKLIILLNVMGFFILIMGLVVFALFFILKEDYKRTKIFLVLGPVLAVIGFVVMMFSIEVCVRLIRSIKREKDPEIDEIENVHHIKHWVHPELIPFGWGHRDSIIESSFNEGEELGYTFKPKEEVSKECSLSKAIVEISTDNKPVCHSGINPPELTIVPSSPAQDSRVNLEESSSSLLKKKP
ncbi:uncharacterized protein [Lepeophtheirus salmonis]|uniref:uncharacterized protein n=1 Tax=Lepeophtheirus salmonis TaxID=72036 RepID=UPI001AE89B11|nr:uncharacterized protein LOC121123612 [Lepeophtheirus salmonis]